MYSVFSSSVVSVWAELILECIVCLCYIAFQLKDEAGREKKMDNSLVSKLKVICIWRVYSMWPMTSLRSVVMPGTLYSGLPARSSWLLIAFNVGQWRWSEPACRAVLNCILFGPNSRLNSLFVFSQIAPQKLHRIQVLRNTSVAWCNGHGTGLAIKRYQVRILAA